MNDQPITSEARLWSDPARSRYFLIPDDQLLAVGDYEIRTVTGGRQDVEVDQLARFEVTREEARAWLDGQLDVMVARIKGSVMSVLNRVIT